MDLELSGELWFWRGPAPFHFVTVPEDESADTDVRRAERLEVGDTVTVRLSVES